MLKRVVLLLTLLVSAVPPFQAHADAVPKSKAGPVISDPRSAMKVFASLAGDWATTLARYDEQSSRLLEKNCQLRTSVEFEGGGNLLTIHIDGTLEGRIYEASGLIWYDFQRKQYQKVWSDNIIALSPIMLSGQLDTILVYGVPLASSSLNRLSMSSLYAKIHERIEFIDNDTLACIRIFATGSEKEITRFALRRISDVPTDSSASGQQDLQAIPVEVNDIFAVNVDYDQSVASGIKAGKYDWSNADITDDNYPSHDSGKLEVVVILIYYGEDISTENVLQDFDKMNLRPVTLQELLAIGEQYPDKQYQFPIIALGSTWQDPSGDRYVPLLDIRNRYDPCIDRDGLRRELCLYWIDAGWGETCHFAAVRK